MQRLLLFRVYSSAGEHFVDIEGVTGSIPVTPTIFRPAGMNFNRRFARPELENDYESQELASLP